MATIENGTAPTELAAELQMTGGLFVCCQPTCPYEAKVLENYGETMSFGRPHTVHLRLLEPVGAAA